jgi:hypothetical protein
VKKPISCIISVTVLLAGCVSPQSQNALAALQAQCASGNRDACTAAAYQAQANQQEANNGAAIATGIGAALLGAAVVGSAIAADNHPRYYGPEHHPYHDR